MICFNSLFQSQAGSQVHSNLDNTHQDEENENSPYPLVAQAIGIVGTNPVAGHTTCQHDQAKTVINGSVPCVHHGSRQIQAQGTQFDGSGAFQECESIPEDENIDGKRAHHSAVEAP